MARDRDCDGAFGDAVYEAWRRGLDPDQVDRDRVCDDVHSGMPAWEAADNEVLRLTRAAEARREAQRQAAYEQEQAEAEAAYWAQREAEERQAAEEDHLRAVAEMGPAR